MSRTTTYCGFYIYFIFVYFLNLPKGLNIEGYKVLMDY